MVVVFFVFQRGFHCHVRKRPASNRSFRLPRWSASSKPSTSPPLTKSWAQDKGNSIPTPGSAEPQLGVAPDQSFIRETTPHGPNQTTKRRFPKFKLPNLWTSVKACGASPLWNIHRFLSKNDVGPLTESIHPAASHHPFQHELMECGRT